MKWHVFGQLRSTAQMNNFMFVLVSAWGFMKITSYPLEQIHFIIHFADTVPHHYSRLPVDVGQLIPDHLSDQSCTV